MLEKGYGFYFYNVRIEYVSNQPIPSSCLINAIEAYSNQSLFLEMKSNLDEAIYWHSTAGKAMTLCMHGGMNMGYVCGDIFHGGFMRTYYPFLNKLKERRRLNITDEFIEECEIKNQEAYDNSTILSDRSYISNNFYHDYWDGLSYEEINKLFSCLEDLYINKTISSIEDIKYKDERTRNKKE